MHALDIPHSSDSFIDLENAKISEYVESPHHFNIFSESVGIPVTGFPST